MSPILGCASLTVNKLNQIESIAYTLIDENMVRVQSGIARRNNLGEVTENFAEKMNMVRNTNLYLYDMSRVNHQDGSATISMHFFKYRLTPSDFFNDFLVERYVNENSPVG